MDRKNLKHVQKFKQNKKKCLKKIFCEIIHRFSLSFSGFLSLFVCSFVKKNLLLFYVLSLTEIKNENQTIINHFIFTDVTEIAVIYFSLILFFTTRIFLLFLFYHLLNYMFAGMRMNEKVFYQSFFWLSFFLTSTGSLLASEIIFPNCWYIFCNYFYTDLLNFSKLFLESRVNECVFFYLQIISLSFYIYVLYSLSFLLTNNYFFCTLVGRKFNLAGAICFTTLIIPFELMYQLVSLFLILVLYETFFFFLLMSREFLKHETR